LTIDDNQPSHPTTGDQRHQSPYQAFTREEWEKLRAAMPQTLSEERLVALRGLNERISLHEVSQIYLPLSRLLDLYVAATQKLHTATNLFLQNGQRQEEQKVPYVIGIAGSVAVGKSTTARILQALLSDWPTHPHVDLVTTDGFLYPNHVLDAKGLMERKGFPESYNVRRLLQFLIDVKSGQMRVNAPKYSHLTYDILPNEVQIIEQPDILIFEGLNVLQTRHTRKNKAPRLFVSDFFDFSIYVDAEEKDIEQWYIERFLTLRETAFRNPASYFRRYAQISSEEAVQTAQGIWEKINRPNLKENIEPTRGRAHLIMKKGSDHAVQEVKLRKV
jgi:type I pantothenate kinase